MTEKVARGGAEQRERALDYLTFFAQNWRMNIVFLLNHDMGIYLFIDIAHFLSSGRTAENEPCLFFILSFIISVVCTSMHVKYLHGTRKIPKAASRAFLCGPTLYLSTFPLS